MIVTIANFKDGSGKTTTAIQIAAFMQTLGPTILAMAISYAPAPSGRHAGTPRACRSRWSPSANLHAKRATGKTSHSSMPFSHARLGNSAIRIDNETT